MNFMPPKPEQRRTYIDGISVIKSAAIPLEPVAKRAVPAREAVLAHRVIRISKTNRLGLPVAGRSLRTLAKMRNLDISSATTARMTVRAYAEEAAQRLKVWSRAASAKNWQAFIPGMYKKYTADSGVQVNTTFKGHGATLMVAALALLGVLVWPQAPNVPQPAPIAANGTVATATPAVFSSVDPSNEAAAVAAAATAAGRVTAATPYYADDTRGSIAASDATKEKPLPVPAASSTAPSSSVPKTTAPSGTTQPSQPVPPVVEDKGEPSGNPTSPGGTNTTPEPTPEPQPEPQPQPQPETPVEQVPEQPQSLLNTVTNTVGGVTNAVGL